MPWRAAAWRARSKIELFDDSLVENVMLGAYSRLDSSLIQRLSVEPKATLALADEILRAPGSRTFATPKRSLDFGRQKLLEVARALEVSPQLLLLDEPAAGLRSREIERWTKLLTDLNKSRGITILLVEHVMQLVMSISNRITVLSFGEKILR